VNQGGLKESGDLAVVRGAYRFTAYTSRPAKVQTGKFVGVWHQREGDWRLRMNISNHDAPMPEQTDS
jgi:ketosteroid isomerase-like protein